MVIKNGQKTNRLQELGKDGQLTSSVIDLIGSMPNYNIVGQRVP
jgi:hypothetical protein